MTNCKELRIGNYVLDNRNTPTVVFEVLTNRITYQSHILSKASSSEISNFNPIPLTEEWLLKFGFYKKKEDGRYGYIYFIGIFDYNYTVERDFNKHISHFFGIEYTDSPDPKDDYRIHNFSFDLKYVHQLQNLYFALTGNELILK